MQPVIAWPAASLPIHLDPGAVHVWGWPLSAISDPDWQGYEAVLSTEERATASRFVATLHRRRYVHAHAALRGILSSYLGIAPGAVAFTEGEHGKPRLASPSGLHFNLSHAEEVALLAVGTVEVGVDVEFIHPVNDNIAERFFAPAEVIALASLPEDERLRGFFACWTRKEAFLKAIGTGISGGLDSFIVTLPGQGPLCLSDTGSGITAGWVLKHLEPGEGYIGALAVRSETAIVQCFSFRESLINQQF